MMMRRTCQQVSLLLMQAEERRLPWRERLVLRLHMLACDACPRVAQQWALMRAASQRWRSYSEKE
ncbi:zf-HC2 domain-containing protein [Paucibacter soli]|uniref:zf-HC2 domain-containing protein n=1 Tax=Paucibacter soli TaxID=3133433 RepID=UPI0030A90302